MADNRNFRMFQIYFQLTKGILIQNMLVSKKKTEIVNIPLVSTVLYRVCGNGLTISLIHCQLPNLDLSQF